MTISRRKFLSNSTATLALGAASGTFTIALGTPAKAEAVTCISAAVSIASAVAGLMGKGDGTREQFAILNVRLNQVIELQQQTIEAISIVSQQVAQVQQVLPAMLRNEKMRQRLVNLDKLSRRLMQLEERLQKNEWTSKDFEALDEIPAIAVDAVTGLQAELDHSPAGGEVGIDLVRHGMPALFIAYTLVGALRSIDRKLGLSGERLDLHKSDYADIISTTRKAVRTFAKEHLSSQLEFEIAEAAANKKLLDDSIHTKWWGFIEKSVPNQSAETVGDALTIDTKFGTIVALGACTPVGYHSDDPDWFIGRSVDSFVEQYRYGEVASIVEIIIPARVFAIPLYHNGQRVGFEDITISVGSANRPHLRDIEYRKVREAKRRVTAQNEGLANIFTGFHEYFCSGGNYGKRFTDAKTQADVSREKIAGEVIQFRKRLLEYTEHRWNEIGLQEMLEWANNVDSDFEKMLDGV